MTEAVAPLAYRTVLFDLDGTLIDSIELILASHRHATLEVLGESPSDDVLRRGIGTPLLAQMRSLDETRADALVTAYRAFNHRMHDELLRPYEGLLELCATLREEGAALGVVTSKSLRVVEMAFARLAFAPLLDVVVTSDQTEQHKPRPEPIFEALRRLGRRIYGTAVTHDVDEAGRRHYRLYDQPPRHHDESGTDLAAVDAGYVSVSPLRLRLDDASAHEQLASWRIEELA